jgi:hypothetical protein
MKTDGAAIGGPSGLGDKAMTSRRWRKGGTLGAGLTALGMLAACSSTPAPVGEISAAQTAVTAAEQADAAQHAPAELDRARDKLVRAQAAMQDDDNEDARRLAEQALVDARLAEARARAEVARENAEKVQSSVDELRSETRGDDATAAPPTPLITQ